MFYYVFAHYDVVHPVPRPEVALPVFWVHDAVVDILVGEKEGSRRMNTTARSHETDIGALSSNATLLLHCCMVFPATASGSPMPRMLLKYRLLVPVVLRAK